MLIANLSVCKDVLSSDGPGQHCAPSEGILQQLEEVVVLPNYNRLFPVASPGKFLNLFKSANCDAAAKRLACWVSCFAFTYFHVALISLRSYFVKASVLTLPIFSSVSPCISIY